MSDKLFDVVSKTLSASVSTGGTFTIDYPTGTSAADYRGGDDHELHSHSAPALYAKAGDFTLTFGSGSITVTVSRGRGYTSGETVYVHLDRAAIGPGEEVVMADPDRMFGLTFFRLNLGKPATADADGAVASQNCSATTGLATGINGALASGGVATFDVPRNVVAAWTNTAVITITGTDEYGKVLKESSASGTSLTGKKAFKTVTGVAVSADVTGLTVGTGKVLGLPLFLTDASEVIKEIVAGSVVTNGTFTVADTNTPTATTGDIRGTYTPNGNPNGSTLYEAMLAVRSPEYKGGAQYAG